MQECFFEGIAPGIQLFVLMSIEMSDPVDHGTIVEWPIEFQPGQGPPPDLNGVTAEAMGVSQRLALRNNVAIFIAGPQQN